MGGEISLEGPGDPGPASAFREPQFRTLYLAEVQSIIGDQIARVALAILVFQRSGSPALTALVYALSFVPAIAGGLFLSGLADRWARRAVMVACDLLRAALLLAIALDPSLVVIMVCIAGVGLLGPLFRAAQQATLAAALGAEQYRAATGIRLVTGQLSNLAGFTIGGAIVAAAGDRTGLAIDAATFAISAAVVLVYVKESNPAGRFAFLSGHRLNRGRLTAAPTDPAPSYPAPSDPTPDDLRRALTSDPGADSLSTWATLRLIAGSRPLRSVVALTALAGLYVVPEGLSAPYAAELGVGSQAVGLLMASIPLGTVLGAVLSLRVLPRNSRLRLMGPAALLAGIPLALCAFSPGVALSAALWAMSGLLTAYQIDASATFIQQIPANHRGRAAGLYNGGLIGVQGIGLVAFGLVAEMLSPTSTIALAGAIGALSALWPARAIARGAERRNP